MLSGLSEHLNDDPEWAYQRFDQAAFGFAVVAPLIMWIADVINNGATWPRASISAYHSLLPAGAFFMPLTFSIVMFIVNGWLIKGHRIHILMGVYGLGVLLFDEKDATLPLHYFFAVYFFFVGAFLEVARHDSPDGWSPGMWLLMAPIMPFWLIARHWRELMTKWPFALAIILPFPALLLIGQFWPWLEERWLFFAEWIALCVLVTQYLRDARTHATVGVENAAVAA